MLGLTKHRSDSILFFDPGKKLADDATFEHENADHKDGADGHGRRYSCPGEIALERDDDCRTDDGTQECTHATENRHEDDFTRHLPLHIGQRGELENDGFGRSGKTCQPRLQDEGH